MQSKNMEYGMELLKWITALLASYVFLVLSKACPHQTRLLVAFGTPLTLRALSYAPLKAQRPDLVKLIIFSVYIESTE